MYNFVFVDILKSIFYFPLWWYSRGLKETLEAGSGQIKYRWQVLGVGIWIKYWFTPMYGQRDIAGRLISIFMRTVNIIFRSILFFFIAVFYVLLILFKIFLPLFLAFLLFWQLIKLFS